MNHTPTRRPERSCDGLEPVCTGYRADVWRGGVVKMEISGYNRRGSVITAEHFIPFTAFSWRLEWLVYRSSIDGACAERKRWERLLDQLCEAHRRGETPHYDEWWATQPALEERAAAA